MVSTIYTLTLQAQVGWARERFHPTPAIVIVDEC
jgi:hypothetical protein